MESKILRFLLTSICIVAVSCGSPPKPVTPQIQAIEVTWPVEVVKLPPEPEVIQQVEEIAEIEVIEEIVVIEEIIEIAEVFDPRTVTQEHYETTMEEVQRFIDELNRIIRNRNYAAWKEALSDEYYAEISSPENLQQISESPAMTTRRIILRTTQDYFIHVVVPSRANSRVDDIEFFGRNRVIAYTVTTNRAGEEQRLRLYDLEKIDNSWKIIN